MTTETSAADLVEVVCAVPGVRGIEAGIASSLRTLDARLRGERGRARYGVVIDPESRTVTAEVGLGPGAPVRVIVEEIQRAVQRAIDRSAAGEPGEARTWRVLVRVQSVSGTGRTQH
ncbi:hypothetical protein IDM40_04050 [Nocardiopsis sp. HNM0947]|uniref:Asp23/Gls24 family envelope stress response protein n=1 Tax=Nocardiopsis coralli TaxID=2772213 RepID=A0ABR9P235_9ACTN|nr:hypothetical protein [Nocardiopsis coralli]MBE2997883.1 hypothetical protein [Nocardiopsis coralli]